MTPPPEETLIKNSQVHSAYKERDYEKRSKEDHQLINGLLSNYDLLESVHMPPWEDIITVLSGALDKQTKTDYVTDLCRLADFAYPLLKKIIHDMPTMPDLPYILQFIDLHDDMPTYYHLIYHMIRKKMNMETIFIPFVLSQYTRARLSDFIYSTRNKKGWKEFKSGGSYFDFMKKNILGSIPEIGEARVFISA